MMPVRLHKAEGFISTFTPENSASKIIAYNKSYDWRRIVARQDYIDKAEDVGFSLYLSPIVIIYLPPPNMFLLVLM